MTTDTERKWIANVVVAFKDKPLNVYGRALEDEMYRVLARIDDPMNVVAYILALMKASKAWKKPPARKRRNK